MPFIKDLFSESKGGKYSSKKFWGHILFILVGASFALDGLKFYTANETLYMYTLGAACLLIGLRSIEKLLSSFSSKKSKLANSDEEQH